jgi:hypothetical protein
LTSLGVKRDEFSSENFASRSQTNDVAQRINSFHLAFEFLKNLGGLFDASTKVYNYRTAFINRVIEAILQLPDMDGCPRVIDGRRGDT